MICKEKIKAWLDANVWDGDDRSGCKDDWAKFDPDDLLELVDDCLQDIGPKWISVEHSHPPKDEMVLMCTVDFDKAFPRHSCGSFNGIEWWHKNELGGSWQPTHWQEISGPAND